MWISTGEPLRTRSLSKCLSAQPCSRSSATSDILEHIVDLDEIRAETERLVAVANDRLIRSVEKSQRRVLKAEWIDGAQGESGYYDVELSCGHRLGVSQIELRARVLCLTCVKERLL